MTLTDVRPTQDHDHLSDETLLRELEPAAAAALDRHLAVAQEWMPHEYVPWGQGRDFADLGGEAWDPAQSALDPVARTALEVNLLTEDNLPSYHRAIATVLGRDSAWGTWVHRWTAEESRHALVMRDWLLVSRAVDPTQLERDRMAVVSTGFDEADRDVLRVLAYVSFQELATRISHRNTGQFCGDAHGDRLLARVAKDENLHMVFYRGLVAEALELAPAQTVQAIAAEVIGFAMPGTMIPGFDRKALRIARAGIYDLRVHHDEVLLPLLRFWGVLDLPGLDAEGERSRDAIVAHLEQVDTLAQRYDERRAAAAARAH